MIKLVKQAGKMTEWLKVLVLKTGICTHIVGSNPTFSYNNNNNLIMFEAFTLFKLTLLKMLRGYLVIYPIYVQPFLSPLVAISVIISFLSGGSYEQRMKILELDKNSFINLLIKQQDQIDVLQNQVYALSKAAPKDQIYSYYIPDFFKFTITPSEVVNWVEKTIDNPIYYGGYSIAFLAAGALYVYYSGTIQRVIKTAQRIDAEEKLKVQQISTINNQKNDNKIVASSSDNTQIVTKVDTQIENEDGLEMFNLFDLKFLSFFE